MSQCWRTIDAILDSLFEPLYELVDTQRAIRDDLPKIVSHPIFKYPLEKNGKGNGLVNVNVHLANYSVDILNMGDTSKSQKAQEVKG